MKHIYSFWNKKSYVFCAPSVKSKFYFQGEHYFNIYMGINYSLKTCKNYVQPWEGWKYGNIEIWDIWEMWKYRNHGNHDSSGVV